MSITHSPTGADDSQVVRLARHWIRWCCASLGGFLPACRPSLKFAAVRGGPFRFRCSNVLCQEETSDHNGNNNSVHGSRSPSNSPRQSTKDITPEDVTATGGNAASENRRILRHASSFLKFDDILLEDEDDEFDAMPFSLQLCDLDAALPLGSVLPPGMKFSSAYFAPEVAIWHAATRDKLVRRTQQQQQQQQQQQISLQATTARVEVASADDQYPADAAAAAAATLAASEEEEALEDLPRLVVDASLDVWSLGVVLFEICSGQHLFPQDMGNDNMVNPQDLERLCVCVCSTIQTTATRVCSHVRHTQTDTNHTYTHTHTDGSTQRCTLAYLAGAARSSISVTYSSVVSSVQLASVSLATVVRCCVGVCICVRP